MLNFQFVHKLECKVPILRNITSQENLKYQ